MLNIKLVSWTLGLWVRGHVCRVRELWSGYATDAAYA